MFLGPPLRNFWIRYCALSPCISWFFSPEAPEPAGETRPLAGCVGGERVDNGGGTTGRSGRADLPNRLLLRHNHAQQILVSVKRLPETSLNHAQQILVSHNHAQHILVSHKHAQ